MKAQELIQKPELLTEVCLELKHPAFWSFSLSVTAFRSFQNDLNTWQLLKTKEEELALKPDLLTKIR